jgi:pimeloyl-ACP methyl ester carboxylesterase
MKRLVIFIHGLGGSAAGTWKQFPALIAADAALAGQYDVATFEYDTGGFGAKPPLAKVAAILKTEIDNRHGAYSDIALIAHSQGGLVARYYIAERINSGQPLRAKRLLTFATPHQGAGLATWLSKIPFASPQAFDLDPNSDFLQALGVAWGQAKPDLKGVLTRYVVAAEDAIVGQVSAMGIWSPGYEVIGGDGHRSAVKPANAEQLSFLIARKFLLEEGLQPGGVEADYRAPLLRFRHVEAQERTRFIYSARALPFLGREKEKSQLADFLDEPQEPFRWMVMLGSGGVGKSRLALELCLAIRNDWHAGFLPQDGEEPDWGKWQPLMPTLIVIDYAARDTARNSKLLQALAGRGPADGTQSLAAPVRVLLLERVGGDEWLGKLRGFGTSEARVAATAAPLLELETIDDLWPIFEYILGQNNQPLPDKAETLAALGAIDSERRPLFAYFAADAIAQGDDIRQFDKEQLLSQVIKRSREGYWKPAGADAKDERLLAVASMAGSVKVDALEGLAEKLLPEWDVDRHPAIFLAMTGRESGEIIAALEPDIVGEHFVLACLAQNNLNDANRARLCDLAWGFDPRGMAQFMVRVVHDFRSHDPAAVRAFLGIMRGVAAQRDDADLWESWAGASAASIGGDLPTLLRNSVLSRPAKDPSGPSAQPAFFHENPLVSRDRATAEAVLDNLRAEATARQEPALLHHWSYAAFALMDDLASRDPVAALTLLNDILTTTRGLDDGDPLSLFDAYVRNIVNAAMAPWTDKMSRAMEAHGDAAIRQQWTEAAATLVSGQGLRTRHASLALTKALHELAEQHDESPLWQCWALASANLIVALGSHDPETSQRLVSEMLKAVNDHPAEPGGWQTAIVGLLFQVGFGLTQELAKNDPAAAKAFCAEVLGYPDDLLQMMKFGE